MLFLLGRSARNMGCRKLSNAFEIFLLEAKSYKNVLIFFQKATKILISHMKMFVKSL